MKEIETAVDEIKDRAGAAVIQRAAYDQAASQEFQARLALLHRSLEAARPAIREISDWLPVLRSRPGCDEHGVAPGTNRVGKVHAAQVLPSVAVGLVAEEWAWWMDVQGDRPNCRDRNCWTYDWRPIAPGKVLEAVPLVTVVRGILERIDEQLSGGRLRRARQLDARTAKLRALCVLLGEPEGG